jgi:hypothetical protein
MKRLLLFLLSTCCLAQNPTPPSQAAGYTYVWGDNFSTGDVPCTTTNTLCNWYNPGVYNLAVGGAITNPSDTYLNLEWSSGITGGNWANISTMAQDGSNNGRAFGYGYFEVSMLFNPTTGSWPAIWFKPAGYIGPALNTGAELDVMEWQSNNPTVIYGTTHNWVNGVDEASNGFTNANQFTPTGSPNFATYHTYGMLWTPAAVSWYFDNALLGTQSTTGTWYNIFYQAPQTFYLIISQQNGCNFTTTCSGQVSPLNMQVQWVHVFAPPTNPGSVPVGAKYLGAQIQ